MGNHARPSRGGRWARVAAPAAALAISAGAVLFHTGQTADEAAPAGAIPAPSATSAEATPAPPDPPEEAAPGTAGSAGPLTGRSLYVDPAGAAAEQVRAWEQAGRTADAAVLRRIADRPVATWFADARPGFEQRARTLVGDATRAGKLPVLTLYHIPNRDCAGQSAGGAADADAYRRWISAVASALRGHRAVVVLEPDAVAQAVQGCLAANRIAERYALLGYAIDALRALPGVVVYLDAGNPSWIRETDRMSTALRRAGVGRAHGFALNVANFEATGDNLDYGARLSRLLDGAHFVVDTSRNGNGPAQIGAGDQHWCNPPGRKLGEVPTTRTGHQLVDAYLWVKRPGESDGACGQGAPPAGEWWPDYALQLAR